MPQRNACVNDSHSPDDLVAFLKTNVSLITLALLRLTPLPSKDEAPDAPLVSPTAYDPAILHELELHHMIEISADGASATLTPLGDRVGDMLAAAAIEAIDDLLSEGGELDGLESKRGDGPSCENQVDPSGASGTRLEDPSDPLFDQLGADVPFDEERYEAACEQVRAENNHYLDIFERDLADAGFADSTINRHLDNVTFYLNDFLLYYDINRMEDGCAQVHDFLGDFFIRKCMWSTPAAIRQYCASLKKFYKSMLDAGLIQRASYDLLLDEIRYGKEDWCSRCERFNSGSFSFYEGPL